uniref:Uncharacterized protein n=1 Tax=Mus musculus TaxID=10090 RepID=Q3U4X7_MOUSE|nr:unnamed protein product [Mus musculus]
MIKLYFTENFKIGQGVCPSLEVQQIRSKAGSKWTRALGHTSHGLRRAFCKELWMEEFSWLAQVQLFWQAGKHGNLQIPGFYTTLVSKLQFLWRCYFLTYYRVSPFPPKRKWKDYVWGFCL